jgi:hypothetical protein
MLSLNNQRFTNFLPGKVGGMAHRYVNRTLRLANDAMLSEKNLGFKADIAYLDVDNRTALCEHFSAVQQ